MSSNKYLAAKKLFRWCLKKLLDDYPDETFNLTTLCDCLRNTWKYMIEIGEIEERPLD